MQRYKALSALSAHLITFKHQSSNVVLMQTLGGPFSFFFTSPNIGGLNVKAEYFVHISSIEQLLHRLEIISKITC